MDCQIARAMMSELVDGYLDSDLEVQLRSHLDACSACRDELNFIQSVIAVLSEMSAEPGELFRSQVVRRICVEKNSKLAARTLSWLKRVASTKAAASILAAAATVAVLVVGGAAGLVPGFRIQPQLAAKQTAVQGEAHNESSAKSDSVEVIPRSDAAPEASHLPGEAKSFSAKAQFRPSGGESRSNNGVVPGSNLKDENLVKEAWVEIEVNDLNKAKFEVEDLVAQLGGVVERSVIANSSRAELSVKVPQGLVESLAYSLQNFGEIKLGQITIRKAKPDGEEWIADGTAGSRQKSESATASLDRQDFALGPRSVPSLRAELSEGTNRDVGAGNLISSATTAERAQPALRDQDDHEENSSLPNRSRLELRVTVRPLK